jgi:undecaprenyl phosphate N,N'-diacetylbacillosamine 1-phosphate transferase
MYNKYFKRILDLFVSILGLFLFASIYFPIAILIKLEDNGPVFYNSRRIGKDGIPFLMYKFRSMKVNSPDIRLLDGSTFNDINDRRVTKIGKFLRETSLDEIPQFLNILLGQMSLIGPRPDPLDSLDSYPIEYLSFLMAKPGITGYNQAYFRNEANSLEKLKHDLYYKNNISFFFDIKIFLKTVYVVLKRDKLYRKKN